jgi:hypothetical protein
MASWSRRRRAIYSSIVLIFLLGVASAIFFGLFYKKPTCTDKIMNGTEQGVDCGGKCARLCASAFLPPEVAWRRFEMVAPGIYNIAAYVVNRNTDAEAKNVPYHMVLYDNKGLLITEFDGTMTLPPHRNTLAFKGAVSVGNRVPASAFFEFTGNPDWVKKSDTLSRISVENKEYNEDAVGSSLSVSLKNNDVRPSGRMTVYAILYDASGNALGFSKTVIDQIDAGQTVVAPFTWPATHDGKVISQDVLLVAE